MLAGSQFCKTNRRIYGVDSRNAAGSRMTGCTHPPRRLAAFTPAGQSRLFALAARNPAPAAAKAGGKNSYSAGRSAKQASPPFCETAAILCLPLSKTGSFAKQPAALFMPPTGSPHPDSKSKTKLRPFFTSLTVSPAKATLAAQPCHRGIRLRRQTQIRQGADS